MVKSRILAALLFLVAMSLGSQAQTSITMRREGNVYVVPCKVNGIKLEFIFDTGADDLCISLTEALFMLKNGYLSSQDIIGSEYYKTASGQLTEGTQINIREIEFAGLKLYNVKASIIHSSNAPLLMGQSLIRMLGRIEIDPVYNKLTIFNESNSYNYSNYAYSPIRSNSSNTDVALSNIRSTYINYNLGAKEYNNRNFSSSSRYMNEVVNICNNHREEFNRSVYKRTIDTLAAEAVLTIANCAFYQNNYSEAIPFYNQAKKNPITRISSVYQCLLASYDKVNDKENLKGTLAEAKYFFPDDPAINNWELNYEMKFGSTEDLIAKLESSAKSNPGSAEIFFNLATTYTSLLKTVNRNQFNYDQLVKKAEDAYSRALTLKPYDATINYNFAAFYFNQASSINDEMNKLPSTTEGNKQYDELKIQRDKLFSKSCPYFETAYDVFSQQEDRLSGDDKRSYIYTLAGLKTVYRILGKTEKLGTIEAKYNYMSK